MKPRHSSDFLAPRQDSVALAASLRQSQSLDDFPSTPEAVLHTCVDDLFRENTGAFARWRLRAEAKWALAAPALSPQEQALRARPLAVAVVKQRRAADAEHSYLIFNGCSAPVYRISRTFSAGGFSKVRVAIDSETHEAFALMVMHPHGNAETAKRHVHPTSFASMSRVKSRLASIDSPLRVLDEWVDDKGKVYWRVKLMATDLRPLFFGGGLQSPMNARYDDGVAARLFLFRDMACALLPVHGANLVHFDVKTENFLIDDSGAPRVVAADLGMAAYDGVVSPGQRRGTPRYSAPEVLCASYRKKVGRASDIFSLGMVFALAFNRDHLERDFGHDSGHDSGRENTIAVQEKKFHDLSSMQRKQFDAAAIGKSKSREALQKTYQLLENVDPQLAQLVMCKMLNLKPEKRPRLHDIIDVIDQIASPELLAHGQQVVAKQIEFREVIEGRRGPAYYARMLRAVPAYPSDIACEEATDPCDSAPGGGREQTSSSSEAAAARTRSAPAGQTARNNRSGLDAEGRLRTTSLPSYWTLRQSPQHAVLTDSQDFWT